MPDIFFVSFPITSMRVQLFGFSSLYMFDTQD